MLRRRRDGKIGDVINARNVEKIMKKEMIRRHAKDGAKFAMRLATLGVDAATAWKW